MTSSTLLRGQMTQAAKDAGAILDRAKAENRDVTASEITEFGRLRDLIKDLKARFDDAVEREKTSAAVANLGLDVNGEPTRAGAKARRSEWAKATTDAVRRVVEHSGTKALVSGSMGVAAPVTTGSLLLPVERPVRVVELIDDRQPMSGNVFGYLQHSPVRADRAAPVPDGGVKPTSLFQVDEVEDRARVIAHLSEPVPERLFADYRDLEDFLRLEMESGVLRALEREIIGGDGTGEHIRGLLATSGVLAQAYAGSPWATIRKALTALEVNDEQPTGIVVHPADAESFDLAREGAEGGWLLASAPDNVTTGLPLVRSVSVPVGTAVVGDWRTLRLLVREEAKLDVDRSGDLFSTNRVRFRLEGRYGLAVHRPAAFATADLTA